MASKLGRKRPLQELGEGRIIIRVMPLSIIGVVGIKLEEATFRAGGGQNDEVNVWIVPL